MKENIVKMRKRHNKEIADLQSSCPHKKSRRMHFMWAPGHFGNDVEVCNFCGIILKHYSPSSAKELKPHNAQTGLPR